MTTAGERRDFVDFQSGGIARSLEAGEGRRVRIGGRWVVSFVSASYLGFEQDARVKQAACRALQQWGVALATPRVLARDRLSRALEAAIASFTGQPAALIFPSTTHAALDAIPLLCVPPAAIFLDAWTYPTSLEGVFAAARAGARVYRFAHNDPDALRLAMHRAGNVARKLVVCNGIYPEGGNAAPVAQFARIADRVGAALYVDDSHGIGIFGAGPPTAANPYGRGGGGLLRHAGLRSGRILVAGTLTKALGVPVAFVAGPTSAVEWLRSASQAFVHSSPPSIPNVAAALEALRLNEREGDRRRSRLAALVRRFQQGLRSEGVQVASNGLFPIQTVSCRNAHEAQRAGRFLRGREIWPLVQLAAPQYPASGVLRFLITALHTASDIDQTVEALAHWQRSKRVYSTVTDFARLRGLSTSVPLVSAAW